MISKRFRGLVFAGLSAAAVLSATQASALDTVRYGLIRAASQAPFYIGIERGYFRDVGIDLQLTFFDAAVPSTLAVVSGDVDVSGIGITSAFFNLAAQGGITIFMGHGREAPGFNNNGIFASNAAYEAGLKSPDKLAGKSIALTTLGSTNHYAMALLAKKYGFNLKDNKLIQAQSIGNLAAMLKGNQAEAGVAPSTGVMPLVEAGDIKLLAWAGNEAGWQLTALATSPRMIQTKRELLERFVKGYERGVAEYRKHLLPRDAKGNVILNPENEELLNIISKYTKVPPATLVKTLPYIDTRLDVQSVYEQQEWNLQEGFVKKPADPSTFIDLSFSKGHEKIPASFSGPR
ncbi:MAG: ABC transporter substrate-binding protein [Bradyrhizobiaceae bacterium]|nr:ABC transporter substrate-binding protein [Bradyrhizobiaceae bacterium]